jgi:D-beta-D-heptose 7-phosphate kinase/D-beta-D-heptose 1-phosphate adenosyltransferase
MTGAQYLSKFSDVRVLVVGDLMLDEYIFGRATRISQEAPVLVVKRQRVTSVPGGAANVAMNIMAMGANTGIVGAIGTDSSGDDLIYSLNLSGISPIDVFRDSTRPTTKKTRVVANHSHQVLRIDVEEESPIANELQEKLVAKVRERASDSQVILLSDYQKGAIPGPVIQKTVALGRELGIPVVANAKPGTVPFYAGASAVSLNRFEASSALGHLIPITDEMAPDVAKELRDKFEIESLIVTLGGSGMVSASSAGVAKAPAVKVEVYDEAGAGDTVIATLALCAAFGSIDETCLRLATHTAASVVRKVGVAVPTAEDLQQISQALR